MKRFFHHSRIPDFRWPQGAVPCGTTVRLQALIGDTERAAQIFLHVCTDSVQSDYPVRFTDGGVSFDLTVPDRPGLVWYYFTLRYPDGRTDFYGGISGEGRYYDSDPQGFRITVYDGSFQTPAWFREGVCYQIFPDRFFRSSWEDFHSRIRSETERGRHPRIHELWSEEPLTCPPAGEKEYVPNDFFGGDLNGITRKLDYLASFGVSCIYLNPVFSSSSNHRYNTADYMHIDTVLGSDEDFRVLCNEAAKRGIRIMLDGVFSHTGSDSVYFNREGTFGSSCGAWSDPNSPYRPWYTFRDDGTYDCWWGFETLPNVRELNPTYVDFITGENGVLKKWAEFGATSWRLDVADELPDEFIRILRRAVKQNDPEGVLLGEVWEDPTDKIGPEGRRGYVNGDELDSVMNYPFSEAVISFLSGKTDAYFLSHMLQFQREQYPEPFYFSALNLIGSHDVPRASTAFAGAPKRDELTREEQEKYRPLPEKAAYGRRCMPLGAALQVSVPGVPCLYYGDEAGLTGMSDPFNRATYPWGSEDKPLLEEMRSVFLSRKRYGALRRGKCRMGAVNEDVFCVIRFLDDSCVITCVNRSEKVQPVQLASDCFREGPDADDTIPFHAIFTDSDGQIHDFSENVRFSVNPLSYIMFVKGE